jgi:hypothetical protein
MTLPRLITLLFFVLLISGCAASRTPVLHPADHPRSDTGYVYARLALEATPQSCDLGVGLLLVGVTKDRKEEYLVKFIKMKYDFEEKKKAGKYAQEDIVGVPLPPGEYTIENAAFLNEDGAEFSRKTFDEHFGVFTIEKGKAYYVGDFTAAAKCIEKTARSYQYAWSMRETEINFLKTTSDFTDKFIHFKNLEKISIFGK